MTLEEINGWPEASLAVVSDVQTSIGERLSLNMPRNKKLARPKIFRSGGLAQLQFGKHFKNSVKKRF